MKKWIVSYDEDGNELTEELIQCQDCKHFEIEDSDIHYWCTNWQHYSEPEDYCSDAERREE